MLYNIFFRSAMMVSLGLAINLVFDLYTFDKNEFKIFSSRLQVATSCLGKSVFCLSQETPESPDQSEQEKTIAVLSDDRSDEAHKVAITATPLKTSLPETAQVVTVVVGGNRSLLTLPRPRP